MKFPAFSQLAGKSRQSRIGMHVRDSFEITNTTGCGPPMRQCSPTMPMAPTRSVHAFACAAPCTVEEGALTIICFTTYEVPSDGDGRIPRPAGARGGKQAAAALVAA